MRRTALLLLLCALAGAASPEWNRFRGPNGSGVADDAPLPAKLGPETNVLWRTPLPPGSSSPTLTAERIYLTAYEGDELLTIALDRETGREVWRRAIERPREERRHRLNNAASSTPATDGENIYAFFGDFGLVSYDADGEERWRRPLGPFANLHGMAASPVVAQGRVILCIDQDVDSYLLALESDTGKTSWRTPRPEVVHGFSTPALFQLADAPAQVVVPGSYQLISYALEDGEPLWRVRGVTWQIKTAAVTDGDTVYMSAWAPGADAGSRRDYPPFEEALRIADANGDGKLAEAEIPKQLRHPGSWRAVDLDEDGFLNARDWGFFRARWASRNVTLAVRPEGRRGDLTDTGVVWDYERGVPVVSSPLLYRGVLHTIKDGGILTSLDAETGDVVREQRLRGDRQVLLVSRSRRRQAVFGERDRQGERAGRRRAVRDAACGRVRRGDLCDARDRRRRDLSADRLATVRIAAARQLGRPAVPHSL